MPETAPQQEFSGEESLALFLDAIAGSQPWRREAACRDEDPEVFVPPYSGSNGAKAKAICGQCVVAEPCLEYALRVREPRGIYGGKTIRERREIIKGRGERWSTNGRKPKDLDGIGRTTS